MDIRVTTTMDFEGYRIKEYKGLVWGLIVRSPTISQNIFGGLKSIIGGQIAAYKQMCEQAREQGLTLMLEHARSMGANAVVAARFDATEVMASVGATEVLCYGTAVVIERITDS